jgi:predicted tellurium resistance membrane protein TerC
MELFSAAWWSALLAIVLIDLVLAEDDGDEHSGPIVSTFWGAMKTIIVADALMGVDNVLGVAGAAHGAFDLVIIGLLISVPIVVFGSSVVLKLVERFPVIIQAGAAVLALTAVKMMVSEPLLVDIFGATHATDLPPEPMQTVARFGAYGVVIGGVLLAGWWRKRERLANQQSC